MKPQGRRNTPHDNRLKALILTRAPAIRTCQSPSPLAQLQSIPFGPPTSDLGSAQGMPLGLKLCRNRDAALFLFQVDPERDRKLTIETMKKINSNEKKKKQSHVEGFAIRRLTTGRPSSPFSLVLAPAPHLNCRRRVVDGNNNIYIPWPRLNRTPAIASEKPKRISRLDGSKNPLGSETNLASVDTHVSTIKILILDMRYTHLPLQ